MTSASDYLNAGGFDMGGAAMWQRLRAKRVHDAYSGGDTGLDWSDPDVLDIMGALASSSSTRTPSDLRSETSSTAYLTVPDPTVDVRPGDRIRANPDDGRLWEVTGFPARDRNAFTAWQPTAEIPLAEYRG